MKKHIKVLVGLTVFVQIILCFIVYWRCLSAEPSSITLDKFYSKRDSSELVYLDSSYDADNRTITTSDFVLDKGNYTVTINYECNLNPDAIYGVSAIVHSSHKGIFFSPMKKYVLLPSTSNTVSFEIFIPYNDCPTTLTIELINNGTFLDDASGTKYVLVKDAQFSFDKDNSARYFAGRLFMIFVLLDIIIIYFYRHIKSQPNVAKPQINSLQKTRI